MNELDARKEAAEDAGMAIRLMTCAEDQIAVLAPGDDFLLLPEHMDKTNTWFIGGRAEAAAFIEGLIVGSQFAKWKGE